MHRTVRLAALTTLAVLSACTPATEEAGDAPTEVAESDLAYCELVEQEVTLRDCDLAARAREQARAGRADLAYPQYMTVGDPSSVSLILGREYLPDPTPAADGQGGLPPGEVNPADPVEPVEPTPTTAPSGPEDVAPNEEEPDVVVTYHPIVGRFTSARLEGSDFEISPREAVTKEIPKGGEESWNWQLTPLREGTLTFRVITNVQFKRTDGTYMALAQEADPYKVKVGVGILSRIRVVFEALPDWIGYLTAILTALTALFVAWFGLRRVLRQKAEKPTKADAPGDGET